MSFKPKCNDNIDENQALFINPEYINGTHELLLNRFDLIIQFIINYITSCGQHGSCWKQIICSINQILIHQNDKSQKNKYSIKHSISPKHRKNKLNDNNNKHIDPYSLCNFWHCFNKKKKINHHQHKSNEANTIYPFLLDQFISYLLCIYQTSNHMLPFHFFVIDPSIEQR